MEIMKLQLLLDYQQNQRVKMEMVEKDISMSLRKMEMTSLRPSKVMILMLHMV